MKHLLCWLLGHTYVFYGQPCTRCSHMPTWMRRIP